MALPRRSPGRVVAASLALVALLLAGCANAPTAPGATTGGAPPFASLHAPDATRTVDAADGARTFAFEGRTLARDVSGLPAGASPSAIVVNATFDVASPSVETVEVNLTFDERADFMVANLVDDAGRVQCHTARGPPDAECIVPTDATTSASGAQRAWRVVVTTTQGSARGTAFVANVTLHPPGLVHHGDPTAGVDRSISFRNVDTHAGPCCSEPNVGVLADGTMLAQFDVHTMRSQDGGASWKDVAPAATQPLGTCDSNMRADPWSGRVYVAQLRCDTGESVLLWSTDAGASWLANPLAGPLPQQDHQKLALGPSLVPGGPPVVYYGFTTPDGQLDPKHDSPTFVARSLDGGATFTAAPITGITNDIRSRTIGAIEADHSGNVYAPIAVCSNDGYFSNGTMGLGVSNDQGATFRFVEVSKENGACTESLDPGVGIDADGVAYLVYTRPDGVRYAYSKDHGATWSAPVSVSPPTQLSFVHADVVAGDAGKLAIVWRGTSDSARGPSFADGWAAWHVYVAFVDAATSAAPHVRVAMVNAPDDPVQRGCIWMYGGRMPCRNLLDFIDIAVTPDGRVVIAYPDGCAAPCPTPADSRSGIPTVAVQEDGPRLYAERAPWASGRGGPLALAPGP